VMRPEELAMLVNGLDVARVPAPGCPGRSVSGVLACAGHGRDLQHNRCANEAPHQILIRRRDEAKLELGDSMPIFLREMSTP
jgi:hypothetical protein